MAVPQYDHIVVVVMENRDYGQIIGNPDASYINALAAGGALLTDYRALVHPSQPNYFALYAGDTFGVTDDDHHTEPDPTIATILQGAGKTFTGYVEHPSSSYDHNPWESFSEGFSVEKDFNQFPFGNYAALPSVAFVSPNTLHDMHDGTIQQADAWMQANMDAYAQWARANNSLLILTWDENDDESGKPIDPSNRVVTILYGADVVPGTYSTLYNHYNLLSTMMASFGLTAPRNGAGAPTIDVFDSPSGGSTVTWTPSVGSGVEGIGIALGTIATSGSGLASLRVSGIPVGATLSDGTHSFVASAGNTSVDVLDWSYGSLSIKPANDANFTLTAQATDASGTVSGTATEIVTVAPLAPSVVPVAVSGAAGQAIPLDLGITPNGLAGDSNSLFSVTLSSIPSDATLSNSRGDTLTVSGGAITFSPSQLAAGVLNGLAITPLSAGTFQLGVSVVEQDAEGNHSALTSSAEAVTATGTVVTGGTISNSVTGPFVLSAASNPLFVTPTGAVTATGAANAINGGSGGPWTITNAGTLAAAATGYGVSLAADGTVSSSGLITGKDGIFLNAGGRVVNSGSIGASGAPGGGASGTGVFISHGPGSVSNDGTITGPAYGVALDYGGQVTNTRLIAGDRNGVRIGAASGGGTVVNSGTILATASDAIALGAGGTVTNAAGGLITTQGTAAAGIYIKNAAGTVSNDGSISGTSYGVDLTAGGSVSNNAGGVISSQRAIHIQGGAGTVNNSGVIAGSSSVGVRLAAGGQVMNALGGSISGPVGVVAYGAAATVTNNGTISGTTHAITFAGIGASRLVLGASSVFLSDVVGSTAAGASNTLELAGGVGTLSGLSGGLGSVTENAHSWTFRNFTALVADAGSDWTLTGKNTIASVLDNGSLTIAPGASLSVTTAVDPASSGVFKLAGGSTLEVAAAIGTNMKMSFLGGADRLVIDHFESFGANVGSPSYAGPQLQDFTGGDMIDLLPFSAMGTVLSYNPATGVLQISNSASQLANLRFQDSSLGSGSFHAVQDGGSGILITHD